jgi:uncharacterized protein YoaH (UPF0181 family)
MTMRGRPQPDLFETVATPTEMPAAQRAMALELIQALLAEAVSVPAARDIVASALEADHDEDHA